MLAGLMLTGSASATLIDRGGGMIYDDALGVTWLQDANYAATELSDARRNAIIADVGSIAGHTLTISDFQKSGSTYTGAMTWWGAMAWAEDLQFGGFSDWRLAASNLSSPASSPFNCQSSTASACAASGNELGYMFKFDLGGAGGAGGDRVGNVPSVLGAVTMNDIQRVYHSGTQVDSLNSHFFVFGLNGGANGEGAGTDTHLFSAWAVRDGDVGASVPEPASTGLICLGLLALAWSARRRARLQRRA